MFNQSTYCSKTPGRSRIPVHIPIVSSSATNNRRTINPLNSAGQMQRSRNFAGPSNLSNLNTPVSRRRSLSVDSVLFRTPGLSRSLFGDREEYRPVVVSAPRHPTLSIVKNTVEQARILNQHFPGLYVSSTLISSLFQGKATQAQLLNLLYELGSPLGLKLFIEPDVRNMITELAHESRVNPNPYLEGHALQFGLIDLFKTLNAQQFNITADHVSELLLWTKVPRENTLSTIFAFFVYRKQQLDQLVAKAFEMKQSQSEPTLRMPPNRDYEEMLQRIPRIEMKRAQIKENQKVIEELCDALSLNDDDDDEDEDDHDDDHVGA